MDCAVIYTREGFVDPWLMYYEAFKEQKDLRTRMIGIAFSRDGLKWETAAIPIISPEWEWENVCGPSVIHSGSQICLFYSYGEIASGKYYITYSTSWNGISFSPAGVILVAPTEPWEEARTFKPCIIPPTPGADWTLLYEAGAAKGLGIAQGALHYLEKRPVYIPKVGEWVGDPAVLPTYLFPKMNLGIEELKHLANFPYLYANVSEGDERWRIVAFDNPAEPTTHQDMILPDSEWDAQSAWNPNLVITPEGDVRMYYCGKGEDGVYRLCMATGVLEL
jgi:hypothetical protein